MASNSGTTAERFAVIDSKLDTLIEEHKITRGEIKALATLTTQLETCFKLTMKHTDEKFADMNHDIDSVTTRFNNLSAANGLGALLATILGGIGLLTGS